jgi:hypothetical protein
MNNHQLQIYGLAGLFEFGLVGDFKRVRTVIVQPPLDHISEATYTVSELEEFGRKVTMAAVMTRAPGAPLVPGDKQCRWCKAKGSCAALATHIVNTVAGEFETVASEAEIRRLPADALAAKLSTVDMVEGWCKSVRAEVEARLVAGEQVPGFKLVQGKRGNRAWSSKEDAEAALKAMRLKHDEIYDYSVISPTTAEKLTKKLDENGKPVIGPRQWPKLQALITQADGKPSVAPESDKRPALVVIPTADDFDAVSTTKPAEMACDLV